MLVLHACESDASPMHVPPFASTTVLVRVLICVPPPQLCEHEPNEVQSPQVQSTVDSYGVRENLLIYNKILHKELVIFALLHEAFS